MEELLSKKCNLCKPMSGLKNIRKQLAGFIN
jgi:hypothetical protein